MLAEKIRAWRNTWKCAEKKYFVQIRYSLCWEWNIYRWRRDRRTQCRRESAR